MDHIIKIKKGLFLVWHKAVSSLGTLKTVFTWKTLVIVLVALIGFTQFLGLNLSVLSKISGVITDYQENKLTSLVLPEEGIIIPVTWGNLGIRLTNAGVINSEKFEQLYETRGGLDEKTLNLLYGQDNKNIQMTSGNANSILNLLWAFGLANKNKILERGPMVDEKYGGDASRFASTGGWTLAKGDAMDHYSKHKFIVLNPEQQKLVERVSKNIYRPCCGNSTYFPDCNHGMAMLGLLELLASQNVGEKEMYKTALQVNSYWFPDAYLTIAKYLRGRGIKWQDVDSKKILSSAYSSSSGYRGILAEIKPVQQRSGGSCGV